VFILRTTLEEEVFFLQGVNYPLDKNPVFGLEDKLQTTGVIIKALISLVNKPWIVASLLLVKITRSNPLPWSLERRCRNKAIL
jgi:hypothetical protein